MNNLVDWEYYNSHFPKFSEDKFNSLLYQATNKVSNYVGVSDFSEDEEFLVRDCICEVLNLLGSYQEQNGLASISNNGYSKSFVQSSKDEQEQSIEQVILEYFGGTRLFRSRFIAF